MQSKHSELFYLEPFSVCGRLIEASFAKTTPASAIYGAILARGSMLDPEIQVELIKDFGVDANWQGVFEHLSSASQQAYLFQGLIDETLRLVAAYESTFPDSWLASTIDYSKRHPPNTTPISESPAPLRSRVTQQRALKFAKNKKSIAKASRKRNRK